MKQSRSYSLIVYSPGFTLIELSVVMVIIGLIIGGIMVGKDLIHSAELQKYISQTEQYKSAYNAFKVKYNCIPGDCPNAYDFWGAACGPNGSSGTNNQLPADPNACNGNNDEIITYTNASWGEQWKIWQHLSLSGLISGNYTGFLQGGYATPDVVLPQGAVPNSVYEFIEPISLYSWRYAGYIRVSSFDTTQTGATGYTGKGFMNAADVYAIDAKADDGSAYTGNIRVTKGAYQGIAQGGCVDNWYVGNTTATYSMSNTTTSCSLYFLVK